MSDTTYKIGVLVDASSAPKAAADLGKADKALNNLGKDSGSSSIFKSLKADFADLGAVADKLGISMPSAFSAAAGPIGIAGAAVATITTAAVGAGAALFSITKQVAAAGTEIKNFQNLTGLSAQSISAIKAASESAGVSLDNFEEVWESFIETLIEGGRGSEEAGKKLKSAGIDAATGFKDVEGSVKKGFDAIRNAETQAEKSVIAMNVFGESGLNIVKVASEMEGGFDAFQKKLVEMGVAFDEDGINQAKAFDKELKAVEMQVSGVGRTIGRELIPVFSDLAKDANAFFTENKGEIKEWAAVIKSEVLVTIDFFRKLKQAYDFLVAQRSTSFSNFGEVVPQPVKIPRAVEVPAPEVKIKKAATSDLFDLEKAGKQSAELAKITEELSSQIGIFGDESQLAATKQKLLKAGIVDLTTAQAKSALGMAQRIDNLKKDKKQTDDLTSSIKDLVLGITFFGDESQEAATKQKLMSAGVTEFDSALAKNAVSLARQLDALKATKKEQDEYKNKLKSTGEELKRRAADAKFELQFPEATELDKFNHWVKENAQNFRELKNEINAARQSLASLQLAKLSASRNEGQKAILDFIKDQRQQLNNVSLAEKTSAEISELLVKQIKLSTDPKILSEALKKLGSFIKVPDGKTNNLVRENVLASKKELELYSRLASAQDFGVNELLTEVTKLRSSGQALQASKLLSGYFTAINQAVESLNQPAYLEANKKLIEAVKTDPNAKLASLIDNTKIKPVPFAESDYGKATFKIADGINALLFDIAESVAAETVSKGATKINDAFVDLGITVGNLGKTGELEKINKLLKDPDVAAALEKEAKAIGLTVDQLKELLRLRALMKDDPRATGTRPRIFEPPKPTPTGAGATIVGGIQDQLDQATGRVRNFEDVLTNVGNVAAGAFMQMGQGLGAMAESWVLMGDQADVSMQKMAASVLAGVAAQSLTLAAFHTAMGIAALTPWGAAIYGPAPLHFKAALLWGAIGIGTALIGRGVAGSSFQNGGAGGNSQNNQPDYITAGNNQTNQNNQNNQPFRVLSGNLTEKETKRLAEQIGMLTEAVGGLNEKVTSFRPGDVLGRGIKEEKGLIAATMTRELSSDSTATKKMSEALRLK